MSGKVFYADPDPYVRNKIAGRKGYGMLKPDDSNITEEGRQKNS